MKIAVDVCIGSRGVTLLRNAGHDVVVEAEHGEGDRNWFRRALKAGVEMVIAADGDIEILAYDNNVRWFMHRQSQTGEETALRFVEIYGSRFLAFATQTPFPHEVTVLATATPPSEDKP